MADIDASLASEHLKPIQDRPGRPGIGSATVIHRLSCVSSHRGAFHANDGAQDASIAEINLRLDRIERRLDLREEA